MKELVLLMIIILYFIFHVAEKALVRSGYWFGAIVNFLKHIELLIHAKTISFLVDINTVYGIIFYQFYLLSCLTIPLMLYLAAGSPQHLYKNMQKYVVIVLTKISRSNHSDKLLTNSICIILWSQMCLMFIKR